MKPRLKNYPLWFARTYQIVAQEVRVGLVVDDFEVDGVDVRDRLLCQQLKIKESNVMQAAAIKSHC
jgi:hypothetical protein